MEPQQLCLRVAEELRFFLPPRHRYADVHVPYDGTSSLGHVVESAGVPLPEVGGLRVAGRPVAPSHRPASGDTVEVLPVPRPQPLPFSPPRFLLDVHLGTLARRLRLVGLDTTYHNDRDDDVLVEEANAERRILLTRDRGLLRRRPLWAGAHVRGTRSDEQFHDVLGRFAPPLAPWTRCTACNGPLEHVGKGEVERRLEEGTRATYDAFARCLDCDRLYWPGAHHDRLTAIVAAAQRTVAEAGARSVDRM
ncbi:Mut7-C RNAse domain-containing protein [Marinactinospora thermotolerans]|uniref:Mut7-C RNAse domain-containing protein n=1 Tax=Marinactinospora thermotolerans TaxID=531310 RepID=UPI003D8D571B